MKSLSITIFLILAFAGLTFGQAVSDAVAKVRQIKLLESTRDDVKRILSGYETNDNSHHYRAFWNDDLMITVKYSRGTCTDDSDEDDPTEIWNVKEWIATGIEIEPSIPITLATAGLDLATFKKEPRYADSENFLVFHNKAAGMAVKTSDAEIDTIIFFPSRAGGDPIGPTNSRPACSPRP